VTTGQGISHYSVNRVDPSVIYRSGRHIEHSDDGGATWTQLWPVELRLRDFQDDAERHVVVSPTYSDRIAYVHHSL